MKPLDAKEMIALLESKGWYVVRQRGSHKILRNIYDPTKYTIVPFHKARTLPAGTQRAIMRDAGIKPNEL